MSGEVLIETAAGPARAHVRRADAPRAALVLGHGAGGGIEAPDLVAATEAALECDVSVALVEQPYRVAGKSSSPPAKRLDPAWVAATEHLVANELAGLPLVTGGRSAGARVACRTAAATGSVAVLCLAFPLQPPPRKSGAESPSRIDELEGVDLPVLVVQGEGDRFGIPPRVDGARSCSCMAIMACAKPATRSPRRSATGCPARSAPPRADEFRARSQS